MLDNSRWFTISMLCTVAILATAGLAPAGAGASFASRKLTRASLRHERGTAADARLVLPSVHIRFVEAADAP